MKIVTSNVTNVGGTELDVTFKLQGFKSADKAANVFNEFAALKASGQPITVTQYLVIIMSLLLD